jgi:hypothetical protein
LIRIHTPDSDPRLQANRIPLLTPFLQAEPIIVLPYRSINILIDGYFCGALFMRSPESGAEKLQLLLASNRPGNIG